MKDGVWQSTTGAEAGRERAVSVGRVGGQGVATPPAYGVDVEGGEKR